MTHFAEYFFKRVFVSCEVFIELSTPPRPRAPSVRSGGGSGEVPAVSLRRCAFSTIAVPLACGDGRDRSFDEARSLEIVEKTPLPWLRFVPGCFRMYLYIFHPAPERAAKQTGGFFIRLELALADDEKPA